MTLNLLDRWVELDGQQPRHFFPPWYRMGIVTLVCQWSTQTKIDPGAGDIFTFDDRWKNAVKTAWFHPAFMIDFIQHHPLHDFHSRWSGCFAQVSGSSFLFLLIIYLIIYINNKFIIYLFMDLIHQSSSPKLKVYYVGKMHFSCWNKHVPVKHLVPPWSRVQEAPMPYERRTVLQPARASGGMKNGGEFWDAAVSRPWNYLIQEMRSWLCISIMHSTTHFRGSSRQDESCNVSEFLYPLPPTPPEICALRLTLSEIEHFKPSLWL